MADPSSTYSSPFLRAHPEYLPLFQHYEWPHKQNYARAVALSQIAWAVKLGGNIHSSNASRDMRERLIDWGVDVPTTTTWMIMALRDCEGFGWLRIETAGKRTTGIWLQPDADLPPNPFELAVRAPSVKADLMAKLDEPDDAAAVDHAPRDNGSPADPPAEPETPDDAPRPPAEPQPAPATTEAKGDEDDFRPVPIIGDVLPFDQSISLEEQAALIMRLAGNLMVAVAAQQSQMHMAHADEGQAERLADALAETQRLRERNRKLHEQVANVEAARAQDKAALRAMQRQNALLNENLQKALKADVVPDRSGFKALDGMMREKPRERVAS